MKQTQNVLSSFFAFLFIISCAQAQVAGNARYNNVRPQGNEPNPATAHIQNDQVMIFDINALINVKSDAQVAIFNLVQIGTTPAQADSLVNQRYQGFVNGLLKIGIKEEEIFIDMISQVPIFEYAVEKKLFSKTYNEVPKGIELQKNIHVLFREGKVLDRILSVAAQNEIYDLVKVEYFVSNAEAAYDTLRVRAVEYMKKKFASFEKLGIKLDTVYHVLAEKSAVTYPINRYQNYKGFSTSSLDAVKKRTGVNQVRKPQTMYYNKLPYEGYDIVIDPIILEPAVQFTYNLKIKYIVKPVRTQVHVKREKEFLLLTKEGDLKQLKVE